MSNTEMPNGPTKKPVEAFETAGYGLRDLDGLRVWARPDYAGIAYSDGTEFEEYLGDILQECSDNSSLSEELAAHCLDWPSTYHLSPLRSNLFRPFTTALTGATVLELGAGCGGVTRFLGETAELVVAVEGSVARARANRARCSDLDNVLIVAEELSNFRLDLAFDFVIVVGVLEYAALFSPSSKPHAELLRGALKYLKAGGKLLLAIENQVGLKYFAGAPEDHTGTPMLGLNNGYSVEGVRTFSLGALKEIVFDAGFSSVFTHVPSPDYKLVRSLVTESGLLSEEFEASELLAQTAMSDPQLPSSPLFDLPATFRIFGQSTSITEVANSFLLECSTGKGPSLLNDSFAFHFGGVRSKRFSKVKKFVQDPDFPKRVVTQESLLAASQDKKPGDFATHKISHKFEEYIPGRWCRVDLERVLSNHDYSIQDFQGALDSFSKLALDWFRENYGVTLGPGSLNTKLPGMFLDMLPRNAMVTADGKLEFFDLEWESNEEITVGFWLFRVALDALANRQLAMVQGGWIRSYAQVPLARFLEEVLAHIHHEPVDVTPYIARELEFQTMVAPWTNSRAFTEGFDAPLLFETLLERTCQERDALVQERDALVQERDALVQERDALVQERDALVQERDALVQERDALVHAIETSLGRLNEMERSLSWRLTFPARRVAEIAGIARGKTDGGA